MRKANLARAIEHETEGNSAAAYECYQKAVDISPLIARELIQVEKGFLRHQSGLILQKDRIVNRFIFLDAA